MLKLLPCPACSALSLCATAADVVCQPVEQQQEHQHHLLMLRSPALAPAAAAGMVQQLMLGSRQLLQRRQQQLQVGMQACQHLLQAEGMSSAKQQQQQQEGLTGVIAGVVGTGAWLWQVRCCHCRTGGGLLGEGGEVLDGSCPQHYEQ
jgi:hypothetical protein